MPGIHIRTVEFQRRSDGHPLDDVIVHGVSAIGATAALAVQVKRTATLAPGDLVFREVVLQMGQTALRDDFTSTCYELAVAIERTSTQIEQHYHEVLRWARTHSTAAGFMAHIQRPRQASQPMRVFVKTVRDHLADGGFAHDDEAVFAILRRFQILPFDFGHPASLAEAWARDRAALLLAPADIPRAGELWALLAESSALAASTGGDWTTETLKAHLATRSTFQWANDRRLAGARRAIAEASRQTLADIRDRIGTVSIDRSSRVTELHGVLAAHRYVEIRGDAGVGKSGLLKFLAEQISIEATTITLNPERTIPGGWLALRSALDCDCNVREFLSDLAADGGGYLFIDGVDQVDDPDKRATLSDLIRAAAQVPGFKVVVTARRNFGEDGSNWLPTDAIAALAPSPPVTIAELSDDEVDALATADGTLAALLDPGHVAKDVVRNLFRLSRLVERSGGDDFPATEVAMARQWWDSADGPAGAGVRMRARLLTALAETTLTTVMPFRADAAEPSAIAELIARGSVREISRDALVFAHDVLRDWAVACLLHDDPSRLDGLSWANAPPPSLARGFELCARMALELNEDSVAWKQLFQRVSTPGVHPTWRRAALMALVRTERAPILLDLVMAPLVDQSGLLLRELIRTTMSTDSEPAQNVFRRAGVELALPSDFLMPIGHAWPRLLMWLMARKVRLPQAALPDVVDLAARWLMATFGQDSLAPTLLAWLHDCLVLWTDPYRPLNVRANDRDLDWGLDHGAERELIRYLRRTFLLFCGQVPALADQYLRSFIGRRPGGDIERDLLKHYGATPKAAPDALAALTLYTLTASDPDDEEEMSSHHRRDHGAFNLLEHELHPASPGQGPFYALLQAAPANGLSLVRAVVGHALAYRTNGQPPGDNGIEIPFADGARRFPWMQSYDWSRANNSSNVAASALMALELWAHGRADSGDPIENILADVLGGTDPSAAYLLVAVDILLSHWEVGAAAALPFMSSADLLAIDEERLGVDNINASGMAEMFMGSILGGLAAIPEPLGLAPLATLKAKPSRRMTLQEVIYHFTFNAPDADRLQLKANLEREVQRVGPPDPLQDTLRDVRFVVFHALNLLERRNYHQVRRALPSGEVEEGLQYRSPPEEMQLIERHESRSGPEMEDLNLRLAMAKALREPTTLTADLLAQGVVWAQREDIAARAIEDDWVARSQVIAATLLLRDGDEALRLQHQVWARERVTATLTTPENMVSRFHSRLDYNPHGIAGIGLLALARNEPSPDNLRAILGAASRNGVSLAQAIAMDVNAVSRIHLRLPGVVLGMGLAGQVRPSRRFGDSEEVLAARAAVRLARLDAMIDAELRWLAGDGQEPVWPAFPDAAPSTRPRGIRLPGGNERDDADDVAPPPEPEQEVDHSTAAQWLSLTIGLVGTTNVATLRSVVEHYAAWTAKANGAGIATNRERVEHAPGEWTSAYMKLAVAALPGLNKDEADALVLIRLATYPDEPYLDAVEAVLPAADAAYFNDGPLDLAILLHIRSRVLARLTQSNDWQWHIARPSTGVSFDLGPALAALFIHVFEYGAQPKCLLRPSGLERMDPVMESLCALTEAGSSSLYVSKLFLGLVEVKVLPRHLLYVLRAAAAWLTAYPDSTAFWVDYGVGGRLCQWLATAMADSPDQFTRETAVRGDIERILNAAVGLGVAPAAGLEGALQRLGH